MISIFSLSSSHDDAVIIVVKLMTTFGCVRYSAYRIVFYPARLRMVVFCLVWRFPSSFKKKVHLCIGGITLQECGGGFYWLLRRGHSYPQAITKSPISCHIGFFLVQDLNLSWTFSSAHFSSKTLVSRSSHVLPRTFFWSRHFEAF